MLSRGKYDNPDAEGEVSHFQALSSALSATVGLGNIAGVAIAVSLGGPGAIFWMIIAGFLGMSSKFTECTLGQKYREIRPDGRVMGGAMFYLPRAWPKRGSVSLEKVSLSCLPFFASAARSGVETCFKSISRWVLWGKQFLGLRITVGSMAWSWRW